MLPGPDLAFLLSYFYRNSCLIPKGSSGLLLTIILDYWFLKSYPIRNTVQCPTVPNSLVAMHDIAAEAFMVLVILLLLCTFVVSSECWLGERKLHMVIRGPKRQGDGLVNIRLIIIIIQVIDHIWMAGNSAIKDPDKEIFVFKGESALWLTLGWLFSLELVGPCKYRREGEYIHHPV